MWELTKVPPTEPHTYIARVQGTILARCIRFNILISNNRVRLRIYRCFLSNRLLPGEIILHVNHILYLVSLFGMATNELNKDNDLNITIICICISDYVIFEINLTMCSIVLGDLFHLL